MKVAELIEILEEENPEAEVVLQTDCKGSVDKHAAHTIDEVGRIRRANGRIAIAIVG